MKPTLTIHADRSWFLQIEPETALEKQILEAVACGFNSHSSISRITDGDTPVLTIHGETNPDSRLSD